MKQGIARASVLISMIASLSIAGSGTIVHLNGRKVSDVLPDVGFYNALLKIWLGDKPVDSRLKPMMLGETPDEAPRGNVY